MTKPIFGQNPFHQRLLEQELEEALKDIIKSDPKWEKKQKETSKNCKSLHDGHCEQIKTYLHRIESLLDDRKDREHHDHESVDTVKAVHDRVKDVHDHLDRFKQLPVRTVSESKE